jgi:hypothetical protein
LIGLNNLWTNPTTLTIPELDRARATEVIAKIDDVLAWQLKTDTERDQKFMQLGEYLCEVRSRQYWRIENFNSFDEFLEKRFPQSRRKAYYLMAIHEQIPRSIRRELACVGWSKAKELVKVARRDGDKFDSATWLHHAKSLPKDEFKFAVERHVSGKHVEPWDLLYFKLGKKQIPVIENALEKAALMLGSQRSRGHCLEMICADFLAGASLEEPNLENLIQSIQRLVDVFDGPVRAQLISAIHDLW